MDAYENTEMSTLKFMEDYPELMDRYDIRDHYELHNLLKKIVVAGSYHNFHCGRMPTIRFGHMDRREAFIELLQNHSPISRDDFIELIHHEFGYEKATIGWTYLSIMDEYYHMGEYRFDHKVMPENRRSAGQYPVFIAACCDIINHHSLSDVTSYSGGARGWIMHTPLKTAVTSFFRYW